MKSAFFALAAVLIVGLLLVGCMDSAKPSPSASAQPSLVPETSRGSGSMASPSPDPSGGSGSMGSATPSPTPGSGSEYLDDSTAQDVDSTGSDIEDLEEFSDDLSAGDVEYAEG